MNLINYDSVTNRLIDYVSIDLRSFKFNMINIVQIVLYQYL